MKFEKESKSFHSPASRKLYNYKDQATSKTIHVNINGRKRMNELPPLNREAAPKPKVVLFYKNGDRNFRGHHVTVTTRRFRSFDTLLNELTRITNLPQGVRFIFTPVNGRRVESLDELEDGKSYVCGEYPRLKKMNYAHAPDGSNRRRNQKNFIPANTDDNKLKIESNITSSPTIKPRVITIVRNSVSRPKKNVKVLLNKRTAQNYDQVLNVITKTFGTDGGCVRKLYNIEGKLVQSLGELFNANEVFIAVGNERFRSGDISYILEFLGVNKSERSSGKTNSPGKGTTQKLAKLKSSPKSPRSPPARQNLPSLKKLPSIKSNPRKSVTPVKTPRSAVNDGSPVHVDLEEYPIANKTMDLPPKTHDTTLNKKIPLPSITPSRSSATATPSDDDTSIAESKSISLATSNTDENESSKSDNADDLRKSINNNNISDVSDNYVENSNVTNVTHIDVSGDTLDQTIDVDTSSESDHVTLPENDDDKTRDTSISPSASDTNNEQENSVSVDMTSTTDEETKVVAEGDKKDETEDGDETSVNTASQADSTESSANDVPESVTGANDAPESDTGESSDASTYLSSTVDANQVDAESSKVVENTTSVDENTSTENVENISEKDVENTTFSADDENTSTKDVENISEKDVEDTTLSKDVENDVKRYVDYKLSSSRQIDDFFDLGETLGDGNFAVVKLAKEKATNTNYALKIIDVSKISGKEDMLKNEILVQRESFHPNLVQLVHDFHSATEIYLAMELVTGGDLFDLIAEEQTLDENVAARYTRDVCSGLDYLHRRNIVHRDIKPENLMVSIASDGTTSLKLADFGLAQEVTEPLLMICGTPTYVAPEILKEDGYGIEVDVWAAGVIVYIMLCGFPPFRSTNRKQTELFDLIEAGEFEFLPPYWDDVTDTVKDLIKHILVVDVKERYTCQDILSHVWITQYGLSRNNTMDQNPSNRTRFKVVSRAQSAARIKRTRSAGNELERGENFSESFTSQSTRDGL